MPEASLKGKGFAEKGFSENFAPFPFYIKNLFVENENDSVWCATLLECLWPKKDDDVKKQARISLMKKQLEEKDEDDLTWTEFSGIIGKKLKLIPIQSLPFGIEK